MLICDFCCARDAKVEWRYPCHSFSMGTAKAGGTSVGDWAACKTCHDLIEDNKQKELLDRSFEHFKINNPDIVQTFGERIVLFRDEIEKLHASFFTARKGIATRER